MNPVNPNLSKSGRREGVEARLVSPALQDRAAAFYTVSANRTSITCHVCGFISHDPQHIKQKYCPRCLAFHEDRILMERLTEGLREQLPVSAGGGKRLPLAA